VCISMHVICIDRWQDRHSEKSGHGRVPTLNLDMGTVRDIAERSLLLLRVGPSRNILSFSLKGPTWTFGGTLVIYNGIKHTGLNVLTENRRN